MTEQTFWQEILRGTLTLIAGSLVARLGLYFYFRQKEHEIVKQRYLEQSVDLIASEFEAITRTFSYNWARSLDILKLYRELPAKSFDLGELKSGFLDFNSTNFQRVAHHRLGNLIKSNLVWEVFQLALAKHQSLNAKVVSEVPQGIRLHHTGELKLLHKDFITESMNVLQPLSEESDHFASLLVTLHIIAAELEQSPLRFKDISKFHKRAAITNALDKLRAEFSKDLAQSSSNYAIKGTSA